MSEIKQRVLRGTGSSMNTTIPRRFVKELGLSVGDTSFWTREGNSLRIHFGKTEELSRAAEVLEKLRDVVAA